MPLTDEEKEDVKATGEILTDIQLAETLEELSHREAVLLESELGQDDLRIITLHNLTVLAAAAARLRALADSEEV